MQNVANVDEKVQEAALNAYSSLVEVAPDACNPLLVGLFQVLNGVVDTYKDGATIAMLDCIGTIAQSVGNGLASEEIMQTLLPLLNKKWEQIGDDNRSLLTLFECFEQVVFALKDAILPYAKNIFDRCLKVLMNVLAVAKRDKSQLPEVFDFYMRSMDLIGQIFQALNVHSEQLVTQSELIDILLEFLHFGDLTIDQYVFSMVGDLQKTAPNCMLDKLPRFIKIAISHLYYSD